MGNFFNYVHFLGNGAPIENGFENHFNQYKCLKERFQNIAKIITNIVKRLTLSLKSLKNNFRALKNEQNKFKK